MSGKWRLHRFFSRHRRIRAHLPETAIFNRRTLRRFLRRYPSVYIKPNGEHMGRGIIKAWRTGAGFRFVQVRSRPQTAASADELFTKIRRRHGSGSMIIQKTVDLARLKGRPFDIRVMMMRGGSGRWEYAGMLAKVAGKGSVITNVARGKGYALKVERALAESQRVSAEKIGRLKADMVRLSRLICEFSRHYKHSSQIGIDLAVDRNQRIRIIEVNFDIPSHALFARLDDKRYYRNIKRLEAAYRRRKSKRAK